MHFEKLEVIGFKSFAEKTVLNFEPGVTVIVGPNGCGKSNIADAIRWSLGEQSAKSLRASKMEDVIFNGSDNKEPINYAEVSVTLSNHDKALPIDYDQVTISRRVYRSGENEYFLNKTPVRLRDISELLMGTGIGTESYSIIEQGKMDLILSSRPEDRRFVFEEASGITKYKSKKKETLRKLEDTENNLLRIGDIIQEVKRQITSIERQAKKAEKYKIEFERMKELDLKVSAFEYRVLKNTEKTSAVEREDLKSRVDDLTKEIGEMDNKLSDFRSQTEVLTARTAEMRSSFTEAQTTIDKNTHKITIDRERIQESQQLHDRTAEEISAFTEKLTAQEELARTITKELADIRRQMSENTGLLEMKGSRLKELATQIDQCEENIRKNKTRIVDLLAEGTRLKNDLIKLGTDMQNRKSRLRRLSEERQNTVTELASQEAEVNNAAHQYRQAQERLAHTRAVIDEHAVKAQAIVDRIQSIDSETTEKNNALVALTSKLEFIEDLAKKREGFKEAVKHILRRSDEDPGAFGRVLGVLADIISIERGYHMAVEAALGDEAQAIIVDTDADITKAIECLNRDNAGRASFVSLERIRKNRKDEETDRPSLARFVKCAKEFSEVVDHFFGSIIVVETLNDIMTLNEIPQGARFVTRSGIMADRRKVSGGSSQEEQGVSIIGRRDKISSIQTDLGALRISIEEQRNKKAEQERVLAELDGMIAQEEETLRQEQINLANNESRKRSLDEAAAKLKSEMAIVDMEIEEGDQAVAELVKKGADHNAALNNIESERSGLQAAIDEAQATIEKDKADREKIMLEENSLKTHVASYEKDLARLEQDAKKEESSLAELRGSTEERKGSLKELTAKIEHFRQEIMLLEAENNTWSGSVAELASELARSEKERSDTIDKLSIEELQLKEKESELETAKNTVRDMELKKVELEYKGTAIHEKMLQVYKADLDAIHVDSDEKEDWESLKIQIQEIRERLDAMGQVNLVAIDEHKELEERYNFLVHQQEDLVNAKESLLKAIQKINKTTKDLFIETFQKIQTEFKDYFRLLFGGGQAELVLLDEQDVLESGIEIIVRPPGKKLQNIMLLSGGEKALTATALLFAIFKIKPSPFCILDEIDAPLDESNINRFSQVLHDFVKMSQFIIITHNKKTIELADVMYGITMQERGVSKIVSVKFMDAEEAKKKESQPVAAS